MEEKVYQKHEEKLQEMRKRFKLCRRRARILWALWAIASVTVLYFLFAEDKFNLFLALTVFDMLLSLTLLSFSLKQWNQQEAKQEEQIIEQAPVGRVKVSLFDEE